jgi:hypothetical protein
MDRATRTVRALGPTEPGGNGKRLTHDWRLVASLQGGSKHAGKLQRDRRGSGACISLLARHGASSSRCLVWCHAGAVFLKFAMVVATALPLTGSSPLALSTPVPLEAIRVEVVGDELLTVIGLLVSAVAAIVGLIAAIASMRAARAARDAATIGEKSAEHAAEAAKAARMTAEYERATFELAREEQIAAQARQIFVAWGTSSSAMDGGNHQVYITVDNRSNAPIAFVRCWGVYNGAKATERADLGVVTAAKNTGAWVAVDGDVPFDEGYDQLKARAVVQFTDASGLRWERWTNALPTGIQD